MRSFSELDAAGFEIGFNEREALAPLPSENVFQFALVANTQQRITVPANSKYAVFSFSGDFWALFGTGAVAAAIGSAATDGANAELNPTARAIPTSGATHVSVIAAAAQVGSISFYS